MDTDASLNVDDVRMLVLDALEAIVADRALAVKHGEMYPFEVPDTVVRNDQGGYVLSFGDGSKITVNITEA